VKLAELEQYFAAVATSTSGPLADIDAVFKTNANLTAAARLGIYNRGYHYRLLGALASVFERTKQVLGDAEFERLGLSYVAHYPSQEPSVERIGRHFAEYLSTRVSAPPALADLAALEWARLTALVAPDPREVAVAANVDTARFPESRLHFVPSLSTLTVGTRALALFADDAPPDTVADTPQSAARGVAVWRPHYAVRHEVLSGLEFEALRLALTGAKVSHFCALFDTGEEAADIEQAFRVVSAWFAREWIERAAPQP
jgi:hypothetical protein